MIRKLSRTGAFQICRFDDLSRADQLFFSYAAEARLAAQAPYSKFNVGAALWSDAGHSHAGCNIERCSYTQTAHAEEVAIDTMVRRDGPFSKIETIVIVAAPAAVTVELQGKLTGPPIAAPEELAAPSCGHCLQNIWENCHGDRSVRVLNRQPNGEILVTTIGDLYPVPFGPLDLGVDYAALRQERRGGK